MNASFVPLPNLDDRRWADLVDEGRSLIPILSPSWTDHNAHDPAIMLMELLAWIAETDIYRIDRIPDSHIRAFLAMVGVAPRPPVAARMPVVFALTDKANGAVLLPATTLLHSAVGNFRLRDAIQVLPATIASVQVESDGKFRDATGDLQRGKPIELFGPDPKPGDSLYLGFSPGLDGGTAMSLYIGLMGDKPDAGERGRILDEIASRSSSCSQLTPVCCGQSSSAAAHSQLPAHHSAVIVWEVQTAPGIWETIEATDATRSLTLSGPVTLPLPQTAAVQRIGAVATKLAYVRARFVSGTHDAKPVGLQILANAADAEQCAPVWQEWTIAPGVCAPGTPPAPGDLAWLRFQFKSEEICRLEFTSAADDAIELRVLNYQPATATAAGQLTVESLRLGIGTGAPNQTYNLCGPEILDAGFALYSIESEQLRPWRQRNSFLASGPADCHFVLAAGSAAVHFGDGQNGRVPCEGECMIAVALQTAGAAGNLAANDKTLCLDTGQYNAELFDDPTAVAGQLHLTNPQPASGGVDEETLTHAEGRAAQMLQVPSRAVTLQDCEVLAKQTPGTCIARAIALANHCAALPCYGALGIVTVVIVPRLPVGRPVPSTGLLNAVSAYLSRRHVIGTRIDVMGPDYLEIAAIAQVKVFSGQNKTAVRDAIVEGLQKFLDPLEGGPDGKGWPLGRDVYTSEVLDVIARIPGVDHVQSLQLAVPGSDAQCGNVCLSPLALTVSGVHQIEVI
ncbi:putative phage baseplate assembly protein [Bradyrhizobium diazoefficiens]